jgi:hypothetical protein
VDANATQGLESAQSEAYKTHSEQRRTQRNLDTWEKQTRQTETHEQYTLIRPVSAAAGFQGQNSTIATTPTPLFVSHALCSLFVNEDLPLG